MTTSSSRRQPGNVTSSTWSGCSSSSASIGGEATDRRGAPDCPLRAFDLGGAAMTAPPAAVLPPEPPNAILAGLACRCPRCGTGRLFSGILKIAERCKACGLELRKQDAGDCTALMFIFFLGAPFHP